MVGRRVGVTFTLFGILTTSCSHRTPEPVAIGPQPVPICRAADGLRSLVGQIRSDHRLTVESVQVWVPSLETCWARIDSAGRFELFGLVDSDEVRIEGLYFRTQVLRMDTLPKDSVTIQLEPHPDYSGIPTSDFELRDSAPNPDVHQLSVPGCFWIGTGSWADHVIQLRDDGLVATRSPDGTISSPPRSSYRWDSPNRPFRMGTWVPEWYVRSENEATVYPWLGIDAGETYQIAIDSSQRPDSTQLRYGRWAMMRQWEVHSFAVAMDCATWFPSRDG